jgi:5-formyltetrahydrofolate cyclo-ligase
MRSHEFMSAQTIAAYLSMADEVQTFPIILRAWRAGKRIAVPVTNRNGSIEFCEITSETPLVRNNFGILEPIGGTTIDAKALNLVVTPVVAFDDHKHRIGMGGGYYDRTFHFLRNRRKWLSPKLVGVAFECQRVNSIIPNSWDIPLYKVVTEAH